MAIRFPEVGSWFHVAAGGSFEVIAVDEDECTIDIQHFDDPLDFVDENDELL
jgi:hypothetical protein